MDFNIFLRQKFNEGFKVHSDESYKRKKSLLISERIPFTETADPIIIKLLMNKKTYLVKLLTQEEDIEGKYLKYQEEGHKDWLLSEIKFFISRFTASVNEQTSVIEWLDSIFWTYRLSHPELIEVKIKNSDQSLFLRKGTDGRGHIGVRYKEDGKEYYFAKEKLLLTLRGENETAKRGRPRKKAISQ